MNNPLLEYIVNKQKSNNKFLLFRNVEVETLVDCKNIDDIIKKLESSIPEYFFNGIEKIYIGDFRNNQNDRSFYKDSCLYVTYNPEEDVLRDICHELSHFLFEKYTIFEDVLISEEFMGKRRRLFDNLVYSGYDPPTELFVRSDYNKEFDDYLYKELGYKKLTSHIIGLFPDPYSVTSLQEYVSTCFEFFFIKDRDYIRKICPLTYKVLKHLIGKNGKLYFILRT
jgi:hypothetical protein